MRKWRVEVKSPSELYKAPTNVRRKYSETGLKELSESIKAIGLLEFPKATEDGAVFAGWGRVESSIMAGLEEIPVIVMDLSEDDQIIASLAENYFRSKLYRDELQEGLGKLHARGYSMREIGRMTGMAHQTISAILAFSEIPVAKELKEDLGLYNAVKVKKIMSEMPELVESTEAIETLVEVGKRSPSILNELIITAQQGMDPIGRAKKRLEDIKRTSFVGLSLTMNDGMYNRLVALARADHMIIQEKVIQILTEYLENSNNE